MPINKPTHKDMEKNKFLESGQRPGEPAVDVSLGNPSDIGGNILAGIKFDEIQATYPTSTTEVYSYLFESNIMATITVTYTDATKCFITSVVKS